MTSRFTVPVIVGAVAIDLGRSGLALKLFGPNTTSLADAERPSASNSVPTAARLRTSDRSWTRNLKFVSVCEAAIAEPVPAALPTDEATTFACAAAVPVAEHEPVADTTAVD